MKTKILTTFAALALAGSAWADTNLLTDSFSGPAGDENLNDNLAGRQTGILAPMSMGGANSWQTQLSDPTSTNLLVVGANPYYTVDFAPTINGLNLPMAVSWLGTMQQVTDPTSWFAVTVSSSPGQFVNGGAVEYGILFRQNGMAEIWNNGSNLGDLNYGEGYALNQFIPITLVFSDSSGTQSPFNGNGSMVVAYANGVPFSTNNISQMTSGYIGFCVPGWPCIANYAAFQVSVVVPGGAPVISANLPSTAYVGQNVLFSVTGVGSSLSYQWYSNSVPVLGATNTTLQLTNITASAAANYSVTVSNLVGGVSTNVNLTVITPTPGTYEADVLALQPQVYLRYSDIGTTADVLNEGILGNVANGLAEGFYSPTAGPQPPAYPNFESTNNAIGLDGASADVVIPPLNLAANVGNTITMSGWIYSYGSQNSYSGVLFERDGGASGLQIQNDSSGNAILDYDWATGNHYAFNSGLIIPPNQWCFVALVITPSSATIYLQNGTSMQTAVDTTAEGINTFAGTTYVGFDPAVSTRRFSGIVDETAIFSRSLSPTEVNTLFASAVGAPPVVVADPVGVTSYTGQPFVLSPVISGAPPLSYQWYKDSRPISGATNNNYSVSSAATGDSGSYYLHVSNTAGLTNTDPVNVSITTSSPFFTALPQGATVWAGLPTTLSGAANGSYPITYQWLANNVPLAGQTNSTLTIADPEATTSYVLQANNSYGSTNSQTAVLTVNNPALSDQILYSTNGASFGLAVGINNDPNDPALFDYIGDFFTTGAKARQVTHLGYWDDSGSGTSVGHDVGLFQGPNLVASVYVPAGSTPFAAYGWRWVPLAHPITLQSNTTYSIFGDTNGLDSWPNAFTPSWNTVYVGNNAASTYLSWSYDPAPFAFPLYPTSANLVGNQGWNAGLALGNVNLGSFPMVLSAHQINWTLGTLESATNVAGPYTPVPGASSPSYTMPLTGPTMFYRVQLQ